MEIPPTFKSLSDQIIHYDRSFLKCQATHCLKGISQPQRCLGIKRGRRCLHECWYLSETEASCYDLNPPTTESERFRTLESWTWTTLSFSVIFEQLVSYQLQNKEIILKVHITLLNPGNTLMIKFSLLSL